MKFASEELNEEFASQDLKSSVTPSSHSLFLSKTPVTPDSGFISSSPFRDDCPVGFGTTGHSVGTERSRFPFPQVTYEEVARGAVPTVRAAFVRHAAKVGRANHSSFSPASTSVYRQPIHFRNTDIW